MKRSGIFRNVLELWIAFQHSSCLLIALFSTLQKILDTFIGSLHRIVCQPLSPELFFKKFLFRLPPPQLQLAIFFEPFLFRLQPSQLQLALPLVQVLDVLGSELAEIGLRRSSAAGGRP